MEKTVLKNERMNIVIVGHVDHGKSTLVGRLLADIGEIAEEKTDQVKAFCEKMGKEFEHAFLLDALKEERTQGITIDTARIFFKTDKREYIILDAPGHVEFIKNMITGAARAEAALLLIDAHEGVAENSKRHGFLLSMLGVKQVAVVVNKMDKVEYDFDTFQYIKNEYSEYLKQLNIVPKYFIPISAKKGDNLTGLSEKTGWYNGPTVIEAIDSFEAVGAKEDLPLRFFVQDIYKFDERRIIAGSVDSGSLSVGDDVVFYPSKIRSAVASIEDLNDDNGCKTVEAGKSTGITLTTKAYIHPGDLMSKADQPEPEITDTFKARVFWIGKNSLKNGKVYKVKIGTESFKAVLEKVENVIDSSTLTKLKKTDKVRQNDVADCVFKTLKPVSFDIGDEFEATRRFVIVDNYKISGGGIIVETGYKKKTIAMTEEDFKTFEKELFEFTQKWFPHWFDNKQ